MYTIAEVINKGAELMMKINKRDPRPEIEDMLNEVYEYFRKLRPLSDEAVEQIKGELREMASNFY